MDSVDVCVIGAGVVGLAIARQLAMQSKSLLIADRNARFGQECSSRNSEVIHAGIYYPPGSLKATLCVRGKQLLYEYCQQYNVPFEKIGKIIVATSNAQQATLKRLRDNAKKNGVDDLQQLAAADIDCLEPQVNAVGGLLSPSTGIVDSHSLMLSLLHDAERRGAQFVPLTKIVAIDCHNDEFVFTCRCGEEQESYQFTAKMLVNSAGLHAAAVARSFNQLPQQMVPTTYFCKGDYFRYAKKSPCQHLIYPVVDTNSKGLGIHATLDLAHQLKFGPDTQYVDNLDYRVDENKRNQFCQVIQRYLPAVNADDLIPDYAGIRPKLQGPRDGFKDFCIQTKKDHGISRFIQLFGIESPGLTAALSIAEYVGQQLDDSVTAMD